MFLLCFRLILYKFREATHKQIRIALGLVVFNSISRKRCIRICMYLCVQVYFNPQNPYTVLSFSILVVLSPSDTYAHNHGRHAGRLKLVSGQGQRTGCGETKGEKLLLERAILSFYKIFPTQKNELRNINCFFLYIYVGVYETGISFSCSTCYNRAMFLNSNYNFTSQ